MNAKEYTKQRYDNEWNTRQLFDRLSPFDADFVLDLIIGFHNHKLSEITEEEIERDLINNLKLESFGDISERNSWINPQSVKAAAKAIYSKLKGE